MSDTDDRRVQFDFEIDFVNGGGIQGQGFRLDIEGNHISDRELANYIVRDLRLLMVGETRILNKRVVKERHKRGGQGHQAEHRVRHKQFVDLSHVVESGMITYQGLPAPVICDFLSHQDSRTRYAPGTEFQIGRIDMSGNTGTYVDSPYHRYANRSDISELSLERLAELDAVTVDVTGSQTRAIDAAMLVPYETRDRAVLVHTGWDRHWRTDEYFEGHPFLTADAAEHLAQEGATLVGIDSLNIDDTADLARPVHSTLLATGIPICEHLTNLAGLPAEGFLFTAVPAKVRGIGTFPVRAYATIP